jgi:hypothetical protein
MSAEARTVLMQSAEMFRKLGRESSALEAEGLIAELGLGVPPDEAA